MKYIKTYESIYGEISRLNPNRLDNDKKIFTIFEEIKLDFEENGKDLMKVNIIDDNGNMFGDGRIKFGRSARFTYIFGKYHPITNAIHVGNRREGNREIKISYIPLELIYKRNSLEKAFNTSNISILKVRVSDTKIIKNPDHNPNIQRNLDWRDNPTDNERKQMVIFNEIKDEYKVSPDIAGRIFKYFIKEFKKQYPDLNDSEYKGTMGIQDIKKGIEPTIKYIYVKSIEGEELTVSIRRGDDEKKIRNMISNMTKEEYDKYWKQKRKELYKDSDEKSMKERLTFELKIDKLFKLNDIFLKQESKWNKFGFSLKGNLHSPWIEFQTKDYTKEQLKEKLKFLDTDNIIDRYDVSDYNIKHGYNDNSICFVTISLELK